MNTAINIALNSLYQRQITSREQILNEMLRVKLLTRELGNNSKIAQDKEKLFQFMKKTTEEELGFFPADRDDFVDIYEALKDIDLITFTLEIYKNDRLGTIISPVYLTTFISGNIKKANPNKILITEGEKHLAGLEKLIIGFSNSEFTITTQNRQMNLLLKLSFAKYKNVRIIFESIYTNCLVNEKFDYIYTLPSFGYKPEEGDNRFITKDSDGIAAENMLQHLNGNGTLEIVLPARITFAGMDNDKLRAYIKENFNVKNIFILPEGTFRPAAAIKTYLFTITAKAQTNVGIGTLILNKEIFEIEDKKAISTKDFLSHEDWRIELLLSEDDENIQRFKSSSLEKVKLKEVAEVFRGKSILKKDTSLGNISVLNLSNIEDGEVNYSDMDTVEEEERKIKRYELLDGDVVLSCRGTTIKSAVFRKQDKIIIASANVVVIRPKTKVMGEYIKIFFESPIGLAIIKSFQRGTTIMNINYSDIMEMEIPIIPISARQKIINKYNEEKNTYKTIIKEAESRWNSVKEDLYNKLT